MKTVTKLLIPMLLVICFAFGAVGCSNDGALTDKLDSVEALIEQLEQQLADAKNELNGKIDALTPAPEENEPALAADYGAESYEKVKYIDAVLSDRDCIDGANFKLAQKWITWNCIKAGYQEGTDVAYQDFTFTRYYQNTVDLAKTITAASYETDGKLYKRSGRQYVEAEDGTYVKATLTTQNIVVTKKGKSDQQIIVGAHYDGTGTGDNGSGVALALTTAEKLFAVETQYTIVFVFFSAEEYGCYGSTAYANAMTQEEVDKTLYMINMDSLVCGDYCYLYGGVQDDENQVVTDTEAYDNAMAVAESLGLTFKSNPWTWESPAPGYDTPDYASPSTGDWSDHVGFKAKGIKYLYMEATNWEIPGPYAEYDGYGETYLIGMLMNTKNDYLEYIEKYFPGRILEHLTQFSTLLNALLTQTEINF